jgi:hypothetical protein
MPEPRNISIIPRRPLASAVPNAHGNPGGVVPAAKSDDDQEAKRAPKDDDDDPKMAQFPADAAKRDDDSDDIAVVDRPRRRQKQSSLARIAGRVLVLLLCTGIAVLAGRVYCSLRKRPKEEILQADKPLLETGDFY